MSTKLCKYISAFDYIDKTIVVLSAASRGVSIISFASVIGASTGIASVGFALVFSLTTGIIKRLLSIARNKKKKRNEIVMLAKSKLNSIETLISQALIDLGISHEDLKQFIRKKKKTKKWKKILER